jgi:hypothetical protein
MVIEKYVAMLWRKCKYLIVIIINSPNINWIPNLHKACFNVTNAESF